MSACCCSLAGTAACQTCSQNPFAVMSKIMTPQPTALRDIVVNPKPQTNADRIRAMSDEELADFLGGIFTIETDLWGDYDPRLVVTQEPMVEIRDKEGMMDWLKAPVEEGDNG